MANQIGDEFKLYYDSASNYSTPTWVEQVDIGNLALDPAPEQVEIPKRNGFKMYKKGRQDLSITFDISFDPANTSHTAMRDAIRAGTKIHLAVANGAIATIGTIYYHGWFMLVGPEDLSLDSPATISVEAKVHADSASDELPAKVTVSI